MDREGQLREKLRSCHWLEQCGNRDADSYDFDYVWAKDLAEAEEKINSAKWENVILEETNELWAFLNENDPAAFQKWDGQLEFVKKTCVPEIMAVVKDVIAAKNLPQSFILDIECNLITIFMFAYYGGLYQCGLVDHILEIYLSGHLPCGYKGSFQKGKVIVY